jgi:ABC-type polysaccharide/polyol phosphate transport system, ATPase component
VSNTVIKVENLSKKYILSHQKQERYTALRDVISDKFRGIKEKIVSPFTFHRSHFADPTHEEFWALKEVSFEINQGDRVGIIGRNGAGKTTLLKILSRITEPTTGRVTIKGRVASLLEVGTGFHPELTGRENIFLNGAVLGMSKAEIKKKFDEIVAFAEVEKFLDTPVKRYSSGMYVRLAFAVAAHLEPEILIVDEVLAVGDAQFQKKCLGKMGDVSAKEGRTVLFVSHNMLAIQNLCGTAIMLDKGQVIVNEKAGTVIEKYLFRLESSSNVALLKRKDRHGTGIIRFTSVLFKNEKGDSINALYSGQNVKLIFNFENRINGDLKNVSIAIGIDDYLAGRITVLGNAIQNETFEIVKSDETYFELNIIRLPLVPGTYSFTIYCTINGEVADWVQNAGFFSVEAGDYYDSGKLPPLEQGTFLMDYHFKISAQV